MAFVVTLSDADGFVHKSAGTRQEAYEVAMALLDQAAASRAASPEFVFVTIREEGPDEPERMERRRRAIDELMRTRRSGD
jgi:hypothetical protein